MVNGVPIEDLFTRKVVDSVAGLLVDSWPVHS